MIFFYEPKNTYLVFHVVYGTNRAMQNQVRLFASAHRGAVKIAFPRHRGKFFNTIEHPVSPIQGYCLVPGQRVDVVISQIPR